MKITKSQLIKIIKEELQSERMDVGASPEEIDKKRSEINQAAAASRKSDHEIAKEIEGLLVFGKSVRHSSGMADALDKITDLLMKRKGK